MGGTLRNTETIEKQQFSWREFTNFASLVKNRFSREIFVGKLVASKGPARGQQEAKRLARGPKWGGSTKHRNHWKNSHFHEENSLILRAL